MDRRSRRSPWPVMILPVVAGVGLLAWMVRGQETSRKAPPDAKGFMKRTLPRTLTNDSLQEIATALDAPLGTIKRRLHTARQRMREQLGHDAGLASCPA